VQSSMVIMAEQGTRKEFNKQIFMINLLNDVYSLRPNCVFPATLNDDWVEQISCREQSVRNEPNLQKNEYLQLERLVLDDRSILLAILECFWKVSWSDSQ
jgi:hypothetical protein